MAEPSLKHGTRSTRTASVSDVACRAASSRGRPTAPAWRGRPSRTDRRTCLSHCRRLNWNPGTGLPAPQSYVPGRAMAHLNPPPKTFADLEQRGLALRVTCQKCGHQLVIDSGALTMRDRPLAGARFRCRQILLDGQPCRGIGLPTIGAARLWSKRLAKHARQFRDGPRQKKP